MKIITRSACSHETVRGSNPNRLGSSASPECGPGAGDHGAERQHGAADHHGDPGEAGDQRRDERPGRTGPLVAGEPQVGRRRHQAHRDQEVRGHDGRVEPEQHGDAAEHAPAPTTPPSTTRGGDLHRPARRRTDHDGEHGRRRRAPASTPVRVRLPNSMYLWKPSACSTVGVIEPSTHSGQVGQPEAAAGDPHQPAGHDDADLCHEVRQQDRRTASGSRLRRGVAGAAGEVVLVLVTPQGYGGAASVPCAPVGQSPQRKNRRASSAADQAPPDEHRPLRPRPRRRRRTTVRTASPSAPEGSSAATVAEGARAAGRSGTSTPSPSSSTQTQVGDGEHRLGAQGAGQQQGQRHERRAAEQEADEHRQDAAGLRSRAERQSQRAEHDDLHREHRQHGHALGGEQPAAAERGGAEQPQHPGAAVEPGRDGLPGERRRHHGQGQGPGGGEVGAGAGAEVGHRRQRQPDQRQGGQHHRDEQLLAVGQQGAASRTPARASTRCRAALRPARPGVARSPRRPGGQREVDVLEGAAAAHLVERAVGHDPARRP